MTAIEEFTSTEDWPVPLKSATVLLIAKTPQGLKQAWNVGDKRDLLRNLSPRAEVQIIWPGQWSTSARVARTAAAKKFLAANI